VPAGILLGAHVTIADWWLWNQIPVTLGNLLGGFVFTGLALHYTHGTPAVRLAGGATAPRLAGDARGGIRSRLSRARRTASRSPRISSASRGKAGRPSARMTSSV